MNINSITGSRLSLLGGTSTKEDCFAALSYLTDSSEMVTGPLITEYEKDFARTVGTDYAFSFGSGRVALYGLLMQYGIGSGDEVILQAPTHIVVPNAIRYTGATPVYADCRSDTWNIYEPSLSDMITPNTKALIIQHTFGIPANMDVIMAIAKRNNLIVIEDCVHALGARHKGKPAGSFGHASFFSTEETKIISTTMGGMAATSDPDIALKLQNFQSRCPWPTPALIRRYLLKFITYHALTERHIHRLARAIYEISGKHTPLPRPTVPDELRGAKPALYEQRLSNAQADLGLRQLQRLEHNVSHRRKVSALYSKLLDKSGYGLPRPSFLSQPSYVRYPIYATDRPKVLEAIKPFTVPGTWFTSVLEEASSASCGQYNAGSCPEAERAARHLVNLPTHPRVSLDDAKAIVRALKGVSSRDVLPASQLYGAQALNQRN